MSVTSRYRDAWEGFWREAPDEPGAVFWDAGPERTAAVHLALFEPYLTAADLPLVDLGCGNGTQTRYLADRFPRVIGADLSTAAVDRARRADPDGRADYRVLDAADKTDAEALHADLGDANVYVRGVLHQCEPDDRQRLVDTVATLLGERGRVCLVELSEADHVTVRVLPFELDGFGGAGSAMVYAGGPVPALDTMVRDSPNGPVFIDAAAQLARYRTLFRRVEAMSLEPARSRDFIHQLTKEL